MFLISSGCSGPCEQAQSSLVCAAVQVRSWALTLVGQEKITRFWGETSELGVAKEGETCTKMSPCLHHCLVFHDLLLHCPMVVASSSGICVSALHSKDILLQEALYICISPRIFAFTVSFAWFEEGFKFLN